MYQFGSKSEQELLTCYHDLRLIMKESLKRSHVDFGISQGARTVEQQRSYYQNGKSKINPDKYNSVEELAARGKHIVIPDHNIYELSRAVDIYAYVPGKKELTYNNSYLVYLGGVITSTGNELLQRGHVQYALRWGFNWDGDGEIGTDQSFQDLPHFELVLI